MQNKGIKRKLEEYDPTRAETQKLYERPLTAENLDDTGVINLLQHVFTEASAEYVATYKAYLKDPTENGKRATMGAVKAQEKFFLYSPLMIAIPVKGEDVISGLRSKAKRELQEEREKRRARRLKTEG